MIRYLDTSLLVAFLSSEPRTLDVQRWMRASEPDGFMCSDWVTVEFHAALSAKLRTRAILAHERDAAITTMTQLSLGVFSKAVITREHFEIASRFADRDVAGLRAGDALHLAIASDHGATVGTLDKGMAKAAAKLGIAVELI